MFRKITYTDKEDILGLVSIDNKNKVTAQDMNDIKNAINDNTQELDRIMVHVAGDTMTGALNFKANTWNKYGSNVAVGAINTAGTLAVKGLDGKTTLRLIPNGSTDNSGVTWVINSATDSTISGTLNGSFKGSLNGNAATTTKLQTARIINDTSFDGTANITTDKWGAARDFTFGLTKKSVNGKINMSWTLAEIGALPAAGGVMTGDIEFSNVQTGVRGIVGTVGDNDFWRVVGGATASDAGYLEIATADGANEPIYFRQYSDKFKTIKRTLTLLDANGNTSLPGNLSCVNITASGTSTFNGATNLNGNTKISGTLEVTGNTTVGGTLGVTGATTLNDTLTVNKGATLGSTLDVTGATKLKSTADITGNTTVGGTLGVTGATTFNDNLTVNKTSNLKGNTTVGGTLGATGATTLNDTLNVAKAATFNNTTTLKGKMYTNSTIESSLTTTTYLQGNQGNTIINSTATAGAYTMLAKMNSTNGYFTTGVYNKTYLLQYTNKATVTAGTNSVTKSITLLDEDGNATFPEKVTAKEFTGKFTGNSSTTTTLQTSRKINGTDFNGSADITTAKWGTARNINISDATGSNTGTNVSVNGGANVTLKLPSTIAGTLSGNASTATKLATARTISLTGSVTGSGTFDGSGNLSIDTVTNHTHAYLPTAGGNMTGNINFNGRGNNYIGAGPRDGAGGVGEELNNLVISAWYGVSFTTLCDGDYKNKNAVSINTRTGHVYANTYHGALSGNASTATKATQDSAGQQINSTYIKGLSVSGRTITYTKGDNTTGTITTKDTTYPIKSMAIDGSYATKYRTQTKGNTASGDYITTIRNDTANVSNSPQYGSGLAWGRDDTHGYMYMDYISAAAYVGGGNADKLNWVKKLAFAPHSTNVIASASGWSSSSPSTCTINIGGVTASNIVEVGLGSNASDDQVKACMKASIAKITQANGKITLYAYGTKPTVNIPLSIVIMDK